MTRLPWYLAVLATTLPAHAATTCLPYPYAAPSPVASDMGEVRALLAPFPALTETLDAAKPEVCHIEGAAEALGTFDRATSQIAVGANLPAGERVAILLHEVRHLDQFARGICPTDALAMRDTARATFALEADATAVALLVAWVGREKAPEVFDAFRVAPETADIAAAFAAEIEASGDPSAATGAAFDAWYASDNRLEHYYVSVCSAYLDRMDADNLLPGQEALDPGYLGAVCVMPDGTLYDCEEPPSPLPR